MFVRKHAAQRVGQMSVADFIHAFQVGQHVLLDRRDLARPDDPSRRAVLSLVTLIPRYFDVAIAHAADVYLEAEELSPRPASGCGAICSKTCWRARRHRRGPGSMPPGRPGSIGEPAAS